MERVAIFQDLTPDEFESALHPLLDPPEVGETVMGRNFNTGERFAGRVREVYDKSYLLVDIEIISGGE